MARSFIIEEKGFPNLPQMMLATLNALRAIGGPPKALLTLFHESTEPNFRLISKLDHQNQKLAQARDLLLPRLMNGEIAV